MAAGRVAHGAGLGARLFRSHPLGLAIGDSGGRRVVIPREAMIAATLASPLLAVLLSRSVLFMFWPDGFEVLAFCVVTCSLTIAAVYMIFERGLTRLAWVKRGHPARFVVYVASCAFISTGVMWPSAYAMQGLSTVMEWEPARRIAQANVVMFSYLALALVFKRMSERIADERNRAITEHAAALTARLQALQARTNPHFLFNTLNSVMSLIAKQPAQAERMVGRLATLMRYFLEGSDQSYVSLRSELDTVRDYFGIEQVRFGDRLRTAIDVAADIDLELRVPPMVLQPLTENAVLHSVSRRISGGCVRVTVQRGAGDLVELTVTDDGADAGASGHVGTRTSLANLKERLLLVYGGSAALATSQAPEGGFCARVTLPVRGPR